MNPDELRKWATAELPPEDDVDGNYKLIGYLRHVCSQAADAWEADKRDLRDSSAQIVLDNETIATLRKRLEAAEESNANLASAHWELCKRLEAAEFDRKFWQGWAVRLAPQLGVLADSQALTEDDIKAGEKLLAALAAEADK